jgi:anti-sigma-K factor RskA
MSPDRDHEEIEDLLAAFALGAIEPEEAELVRAHLEGCASCTATVQRLRRAAGALPLAVEPAAPPSRLRDQILAAAAASRPSERAAAPRTPALRLRAPRPRIPAVATGWRVGVAFAAIVAFALGAGLGLGIGRSIATPTAPASNVVQYSLTGSGTMAGAQGRVFELKQQGLTLVDFSNLPDLEPGKVYELWLIPKQGQPLAAGVFKPDPGGSHVVVLARSLQGLAALAVTTEAGPSGASAPSQQPQLVGNLA